MIELLGLRCYDDVTKISGGIAYSAVYTIRMFMLSRHNGKFYTEVVSKRCRWL